MKENGTYVGIKADNHNILNNVVGNILIRVFYTSTSLQLKCRESRLTKIHIYEDFRKVRFDTFHAAFSAEINLFYTCVGYRKW